MQTLKNVSDGTALAHAFLQSGCGKIPGVGPKLLLKLEHAGIRSLRQLLWHLPRCFEDRRTLNTLAQASYQLGQTHQLELKIISTKLQPGSKSRLLVQCRDAHDTGNCHLQVTLVFFKPQRSQIGLWQQHKIVRVYGELSIYTSGHVPTLQIIHPETCFIDTNPEPLPTTLTPVYPTVAGIHQKHWRKWLQWVFDQLQQAPFSMDLLSQTDILPDGTMGLREALMAVHAGEHMVSDGTHQYVNRNASCLHRLRLEELIAHQLAWYPSQKNEYAKSIAVSNTLHQDMIQHLPFELTSGQSDAVKAIYNDLQQDRPMSRLLQGDVGCGKTLVAFMAAAQVAHSGYQAVILAPTEIVAHQHFSAFKDLIKARDINIQLLIGKMKTSDKNKILQDIESGACQIIIGTHAVFQKTVFYSNLALVIIDEQHRFGVLQRQALLNKGAHAEADVIKIPHLLMMTATPIPRTLSMSVYAHLESSIIRERPPNRKPVITKAIGEDQREALYQRVIHFINTGQQVFWVCSVIQDSENTGQQKSIQEIYDSLTQALPGITVKLMHRQLSDAERERNLQALISGEAQILLATSMIEVGVNIPNANLIVVENAERWGLAQLHQLRGRVGRADKPGFMILLHQSPLNRTNRERLDILRKSHDGFHISDKDLELRGPGQINSTEQTGHSHFKVVDLTEDEPYFEQAKEMTQKLMEQYPHLASILIESVNTQSLSQI